MFVTYFKVQEIIGNLLKHKKNIVQIQNCFIILIAFLRGVNTQHVFKNMYFMISIACDITGQFER